MKVLGILNFEPNSVRVTGIDDYRPVSSASFLGRYRVLDFMISNLTNSGISDIELYIKDRPRSAVEHVSGTKYNFNSKKGRILMLTGEKTYTNPIYNTDLAAFEANHHFISSASADLVVLAPTHFIFTQDFQEMIKAHQESGNDVTVLYHSVNNADKRFALCNVLKIDENGRVTDLSLNTGKYKHRNVSLETYVMSYKLFLQLIERGSRTSSLYWFHDVLSDSLEDLKVGTYSHKGYVACLNNLPAYHEANLELAKDENMAKVISPEWPIFTLTHDTCPTIYEEDAEVIDSAVGNGCRISGTVIDSMIGRDCMIGKGSYLKNCVLLPGARIGEDVHLENAVVDRYAHIDLQKDLRGTAEDPLYVRKSDHI